MKNERELAELIFDQFRSAQCKAGQMIMERNVRFGLIDKLNPKEKELIYIVLNGLVYTGYITYQSDSPQCFFLTEKGYEYIYDDEKVAMMVQKPWVIPSSEKTDWNRAFNKMWEVINADGSPYYFSQTPFYNRVLKINQSLFPSYKRYLEEREQKGKSRTRKDIYFDLLDDLTEEQRFEFYVSLQLYIEETNPEPEPKYDFESFWDVPKAEPKPEPETVSKKVEEEIAEKIEIVTEKKKRPKVFISYTWGKNEEYKPWVKKFADSLEDEIDVILDQNELGFGSHLTRFMTNGIEDSDRIIVVMTPRYKEKSKELKGGTAFEESIISTELLGDIDGRKIIPVLREGTKELSAPLSLKGLIYCDMTDDSLFQKRVSELKEDIIRKYERDIK
ncbi:MAG TPA: toll/interleukin-1 receptor domain-containing protein [Draconibacterium sp.]|nr:toll/interleukin-1 receptor domain-containing protein [Draconibacterium sp.]